MRKNIVAGNWKMNNDLDASIELVHELILATDDIEIGNTRIIVAPTFVNLQKVREIVEGSRVEVAAQNMHQENSGAFTGEISAEMLQNIGINDVIIGHSERRAYFNETDELLAQKVSRALENNMNVIFCFGEQLEDRKSENHFKVVESQLKNGLFHLSEKKLGFVILAYEPVWAIGTGETASPEQAQEMHAFIRNLLKDKYGNEVAKNTSILYGGSVKSSNAKEIFSKPDVDGGLIGGAALKVNDFVAIIKAFS
ncbi:MAG: triose-phosphate isomerase [Flavobacteriaceae bacterium]|nr:triose-phosphate isomerase [Flavobacteriaceae bacterium]